MKKDSKIISILVAYNAANTLEKFYNNFPRNLTDEIILVDDCSKDNTYKIAKKLGIKSYHNPINLGYGGNMKKSLSIALKLGADIIVDIHPDGEYKTSAIHLALKEIHSGAKFVLGNRFTNLTNPLNSGMYLWKFFPIRFLNWIDKLVLGLQVNDLHQGFRVYTKDLLEKVNFEKNSNNYLFSFELIAQAAYNHIPISQVPVETVYSGKKRGASLKNSLNYTLGTFKVLWLFIMAKLGFPTLLFQKKSNL